MAATGKFIGGIKFGVSMDTKKLNRDIKKARGAISKFVGGVKKMTLAIGGLSGLLGAVGFAKFTKDAFDSINTLAKVSDKLGLTTEALAGLRLAADETGVAGNTLDMALQRMVRRVNEAAQGTGEAKNALKELRLDAMLLAKQSPDEQFKRISEAMQKVRGSGNQVRLAFKLFDSEGVALVSTLKLGRKGLDEATAAAGSLGLAVSRESARGVERAIDSFGRFRSAIGGIFRQVAIEIAPVIEALTGKLTNFLISGGKAKTVGRAIGDAIVTMAKFVADGAQLAWAALLRFASVGLSAINDWRDSRAAKVLGFSRAGTAEHLQAQKLGFQADAAALDLPSIMIDKIVAATAASVAKESAGPAPKTLQDLKDAIGSLTGIGKGIMGTASAAGRGLGNFGSSMDSILGKAFSGSTFKQKERPARGSLEFAESGSAESFRQQARIRNAKEEKKLDQDRNVFLKNIDEKLSKNPLVLAMAGFS